MPIEYEIDHDQRLLLATARGILTGDDIFGYQREVWSRADVAGYDEVIDMSEVEQIVSPQTSRIMDLAELSASMDTPTPSRSLPLLLQATLCTGWDGCTRHTAVSMKRAQSRWTSFDQCRRL